MIIVIYISQTKKTYDNIQKKYKILSKNSQYYI